jgi:hypothetical protein
MAKRNLDWYRRPETILADLLKEHARGKPADRSVRRALVLAVDHEGGKLQNPNGSGEYESAWPGRKSQKLKALVGPPNPRGAIKGRILTDGLDRLRDDSDVRVFWPMFPPDQIGIPVVPGEHVYVMFEGEGLDNGFWLSRVPGHEGAGAYVGNQSYTAPSAPGSAMDSFEPNDAEYPKTEEHASMAPGKSAMDNFPEDK